MVAAKFKILDLVIFYIQHANQRNLFLLAFRFGLLQQGDRITTLDKALYRKRSDMIKIIISQASRISTGHHVAAFDIYVESGEIPPERLQATSFRIMSG